MGAGVIISETEPSKENRYTWIKPCGDGSIEYYELAEGVWTLSYAIPAHALSGHTHSTYSGEFEGTITKMKVENGIVTEVEVE